MLKKILLVLMICFTSNLAVVAACKNYSVSFDDGIYHIVVDTTSNEHSFKSILTENLVTNKSVNKSCDAIFTINAGFFDPKNQKTISYIYSDGQLQEDPLSNENLVNNPSITKNWNIISNRTEFRIINDCDKLVYDIDGHDNPYKGKLVESLQAGPMLLPQMDLAKEYFVVKNKQGTVIRESASVLHKSARTLIGIKGNEVHIFIVTDKHPMDIYEAQELCKSYNLDKAMAFDGGSSTSFDYLNKYHVVSTGISGDDTGRRLKSFLIFK